MSLAWLYETGISAMAFVGQLFGAWAKRLEFGTAQARTRQTQTPTGTPISVPVTIHNHNQVGGCPNCVAERASAAAMRAWIGRHSIISYSDLPLLLVGPPGVGKSTLVHHLGASWERAPDAPSFQVRTAYVSLGRLLHDMGLEVAEAGITIERSSELRLKIVDVPGQAAFQAKAVQIALLATDRLRIDGADGGLVVAFMVSAREAAVGLSPEVAKYFTAESFVDLVGPRVIASGAIRLRALHFIFNRFDELQAERPHTSTADLEALCRHEYARVLAVALGSCHQERCRVWFTSLKPQGDVLYGLTSLRTALLQNARATLAEAASERFGPFRERDESNG